MNTNQMEYVLELAQTRNFNRAAENLCISQPTLTYQIKAIEREIGFPIFERSGRGAVLTPAGKQFTASLRIILDTLQSTIEQGQNFNARFKDDIRIALPVRSALYFLPQAISRFNRQEPTTSITPTFGWNVDQESFFQGEQDILFAMDYTMDRVPDITRHPLFDSRFYVITEKADPLAQKQLIREDELQGRTLMVGGGSPPVLRALQQKLVQKYHLDYFNSRDHDTTLTNVAAHRGICIAPGFLNDHSQEFAWTPFDTAECIPCSLYLHKSEKRRAVHVFVALLQAFYRDDPTFPV